MIMVEHFTSTKKQGTVCEAIENLRLFLNPNFYFLPLSETSWEPPLIMSYKPPPGRDEMGNLLANDRNDISNWILFTDSKGQVRATNYNQKCVYISIL